MHWLVGFDAAGAQDLPHPLLGVTGAPLEFRGPHTFTGRFDHRGMDHGPRRVRTVTCFVYAAFGGRLRRVYARYSTAVLPHSRIEIHKASLASTRLAQML